MVIFAALMLWSFSSKDYRALRGDRPHTNSFKAFFHSQNYWDFIRDTGLALKFFIDYALRRPHTRSSEQVHFDSAFGVHHNGGLSGSSPSSSEMGTYNGNTVPMKEANGPDLNPRSRA